MNFNAHFTNQLTEFWIILYTCKYGCLRSQGHIRIAYILNNPTFLR
jgi:hypothetical protein